MAETRPRCRLSYDEVSTREPPSPYSSVEAGKKVKLSKCANRCLERATAINHVAAVCRNDSCDWPGGEYFRTLPFAAARSCLATAEACRNAREIMKMPPVRYCRLSWQPGGVRLTSSHDEQSPPIIIAADTKSRRTYHRHRPASIMTDKLSNEACYCAGNL